MTLTIVTEQRTQLFTDLAQSEVNAIITGISLHAGQSVEIYVEADDDEEPREEEVDEVYERAAHRARCNDFAETGGKDWT